VISKGEILMNKWSSWQVSAILILLLQSVFFPATPAMARSPEDKSSSAVAEILFNEDAEDFTSFRVRADGYVDITFASNTPDATYSDILAKLKGHPDIKGVLAGRGGRACSRF